MKKVPIGKMDQRKLFDINLKVTLIRLFEFKFNALTPSQNV